MKVKELLQWKVWCIPNELQHYFDSTTLSEVSGETDTMVWSGNLKGNFSTSDTVEKIRLKEPKLNWTSCHLETIPAS